jgi:hypothetical protein
MESDADGYLSNLIYEIVDHKSSGEATKMADKYFITKTGTKRMHQTTQGWKFLVQWANGTRPWIDLKILKESNPVTAWDIADEPAFAWWVPYVLRKRYVVSAVNSRVRKTSHEYGIELPTSIKHAIEIDRKNGNTLWQDALSKEMGNVRCLWIISLTWRTWRDIVIADSRLRWVHRGMSDCFFSIWGARCRRNICA